ncbi:MAG: ABC transporter permease, partial [Bacteroidota bacterium]
MNNGFPAWAIRFLEITCSNKYIDELAGDLLELFEREITVYGQKRARRKLIIRTLLSPRWYRLPKLHHIQFVIMYKNHYKVAVRHAVKHRSASMIHALGLMLGLAAAFYIGLFIKNEFMYDQMHENAGSLYRVLAKDRITGERYLPTSSRHGATFKEEFPFIKMCRFGQDLVKIGEEKPRLIEDFYWADSSFFDLFSFEFADGDPKACLSQVNSLVISEKLSIELFGTAQSVGKSIKVKVYDSNKELPMQVSGVVKKPKGKTHIEFEALGPMLNAEDLYAHLIQHWYFSWLRTYIQVPNDRIKEVEAGIPRMIDRVFGDQIPPDFNITIQAFNDIYLHSQDIARNSNIPDVTSQSISG